jgi:hypothetical protein
MCPCIICENLLPLREFLSEIQQKGIFLMSYNTMVEFYRDFCYIVKAFCFEVHEPSTNLRRLNACVTLVSSVMQEDIS